MWETIKEKLKSPTVTAPLLIIFVMVAMQYSRRALANLSADTNSFIAIGVIQLITIGIPCIVYYLLKGKKLSQPMYLLNKSGPQIVFILFGALLFISGMLLIKYFYFISGGSVASLANFYENASGTLEGTGHIQIILSLIVIPAFCEEFLFRGVVLSSLMPYGKSTAIVISAVCFGLMHGNFYQFLYTTVAGLILGAVYVMTDSIWPSMIIHMINNALSIFQTVALERMDENWANLIWLIIEATVMMIGIISFIYFIRRSNKEKTEKGSIFGVPVREELCDENAGFWGDSRIDAKDAVKAFLKEKNNDLKLFTKLREICGSVRNNATNLSLVTTWREWGFGDEMVLEAAKRSAASASPIPYMNKILSDWKQAGVYASKDIPDGKMTGAGTSSSSSPRTFVNPIIEAVNAKADRERYYAALREKAQSRADKFVAKASKNERFKVLNTELAKMEIALAKAEVFEPKKLPTLTEEKAGLLRERRTLLQEMGIEEEQLLPQFSCKYCSDTGFLPSGVACNCYKPN
jgi:membrane protease YdiL (CAAX protease family)